MLNKADLVSEAKLTWLESYIQDVKDRARFLRCSLTAEGEGLPLAIARQRAGVLPPAGYRAGASEQG